MSEIEAVKNIKAYMYYALDELPRDVGIALTEAIVALRERAEREKGCDLCMPVNTMKSMGAYGRKFTYCPMCGKRLEEHHEAD